MFSIPFSSLSDSEAFRLSAERLNTRLSDWEKEIWQFIHDWFNPSIVSIKLFTSGSTGEPKQIKHSKGAVLNSAQLTCHALHLHNNDKVLLCLPASKISGIMMIVRSIWNKMDLYCIRPSTEPFSEISENEKFDFAAFTPMQLYGINNDKKKFAQVERISKILIGGDIISQSLLLSIRAMKNSAYATFGMTETISHIALRKLNGKDVSTFFNTLPGITVSTDERKCLVVNAPELGVRHLTTNDEVNLLSPTQFEWLGRIDNVINSGGLKIYPEKVEELLSPVINFPFFITGADNPRTGQEVAIAIEKNAFTLKEANDLKNQFGTIAKLYHPKSILIIPKFYRTENGKIKRKESLQNIMMRVAT